MSNIRILAPVIGITLVAIVASGCEFTAEDDCKDELANRIQDMSIPDAQRYLESIKKDMRYVPELDSLAALWNRDLTKQCVRLQRVADDPVFRLSLASLLAQAHYHSFIDVPIEDLYDYARLALDSSNSRVVVSAISVLFWSNSIEDAEAIISVMSAKSDDRLVIDTGIFYLSIKCNLEVDELVNQYLEDNKGLKEDPRVSSLLRSASEICS